MSEIQGFTNIELFKYIISIIGALIAIVNILLVYIFTLYKKEIEQIKKKQDSDHDKINKIEAEQNIQHKNDI